MRFVNSIRLSDFLTGKCVWKYYQLYLLTQWYSPEEMNKLRLFKFKRLLEHCYENVPVYRHLMSDLSIVPGKIKDFEVLKRFPIIEKKTVLDNYDQFIPKNISQLKSIKKAWTSGTTGQVLETRSDLNTRSSTWGTFERFNTWMGKNQGDSIVNLKGGHIINSTLNDWVKAKAIGLIENKHLLNAYDLSENKIDKYYQMIIELKEPILRGYCQNIYDLASIFKRKGYSLRLKAVTTTAEPLMPHHRQLFREIFKCDTFDQYGCGEVGGVAYECEKHEGLHVAEERVILEIGESEEVILTDLDNFSFPLIRYRNGDQARISPKACSCGRKSLLIKEILGRTSDNIYGPNGNSLHWGFFHHLLIDSQIAVNRQMLKFQVVQNSLHDIDFLLVSQPLNVKEKDLLVHSIRRVLGDISVNIKNVQDIPLQVSGKHKAVVSALNKR